MSTGGIFHDTVASVRRSNDMKTSLVVMAILAGVHPCVGMTAPQTLHLTSFPEVATDGADFTLACTPVQGRELISVKWYRNNVNIFDTSSDADASAAILHPLTTSPEYQSVSGRISVSSSLQQHNVTLRTNPTLDQDSVWMCQTRQQFSHNLTIEVKESIQDAAPSDPMCPGGVGLLGKEYTIEFDRSNYTGFVWVRPTDGRYVVTCNPSCSPVAGYRATLNTTHSTLTIDSVGLQDVGTWKIGDATVADVNPVDVCPLTTVKIPQCGISSDEDTDYLEPGAQLTLTVDITGYYCSREASFDLTTGAVTEELTTKHNVSDVSNLTLNTSFKVDITRLGDVSINFMCDRSWPLQCEGIQDLLKNADSTPRDTRTPSGPSSTDDKDTMTTTSTQTPFIHTVEFIYVVAGSAGVVVIVVVIVIVVLLCIRSRREGKCQTNEAEKDNGKEGGHNEKSEREAIVMEDNDLYHGFVRTETQESAEEQQVSDVYAKVNKVRKTHNATEVQITLSIEDLYAKPNKPASGKSEAPPKVSSNQNADVNTPD